MAQPESSLIYVQGRESFRLSLGVPVCAGPGGGVLLASSGSDALSPCIGIVAQVNRQNFNVGIVAQGPLTLSNWTAIVGTPLLSTNTPYYLAVASGKLTANPSEAGARLRQAVGIATDTTTLLVQLGGVPISPVSAITLTDSVTGKPTLVTVADGEIMVTQ